MAKIMSQKCFYTGGTEAQQKKSKWSELMSKLFINITQLLVIKFELTMCHLCSQ